MPTRFLRVSAAILPSLALLGSLIGFIAVVNQHYPIVHWLFWRYIGYWLVVLIWAASVTSFGFFLCSKLNAARRTDESPFALAFPLGVFAFALAILALGLVHLLNTTTFVALPLLFLGPGLAELTRRVARRVRCFERIGLGDLPVFLFGCLGIALIYFQILTPETLGHDARWYHLPLGQNYAYHGGIEPSPEGWWLAAYPHLASYLYAWAFLLPHALLFDRYELCSHIEFVIFLGTLASLPALVRELLPGVKAKWAWVSLFLFPGIFLYDGNLNGAADHIAALWAVPIAITTIRVCQHFSLKNCLLWAAFVSAAGLTKYMAACIMVSPIVFVAVRALWLFIRPGTSSFGRRTVIRTFGITVAVGLLLTSAHWGKNWIWYGDPLYPIFHRELAIRPWNPDAPALMETVRQFSRSPETGLVRRS